MSEQSLREQILAPWSAALTIAQGIGAKAMERVLDYIDGQIAPPDLTGPRDPRRTEKRQKQADHIGEAALMIAGNIGEEPNEPLARERTTHLLELLAVREISIDKAGGSEKPFLSIAQSMLVESEGVPRERANALIEAGRATMSPHPRFRKS